MGFDFSGHVLRGPRTATTNRPTSAEPTTGVVRDIKPVPPVYDLAAPEAPALVDTWGDQYRVAVLDAAGTTPIEYLIWAENTSNLSLVDDPSWWVEDGTGGIPISDVEVENGDPDPEGFEPNPYTDGSLRVVVTDNGNRSLSRITHLVIARGDVTDYNDTGWVDDDDPSQGRKGTNPYPVVVASLSDQNADLGTVALSDFNVYTATGSGLVQGDLASVLGGGLSNDRGDEVITVRYTLAPARFWWTRNDRYDTRFGYNGTSQKWEPYHGSAPKNLGRLTSDETYTLTPKLARYPAGSILPGNASSLDSYAMIRLGEVPDSSSLPVAPDSTGTDVWLGILVLSDADAAEYEFPVMYSGVVGQQSGVLRFNPDYVDLHAGKAIWYVYQDFEEGFEGVIGEIGDDLFIAPVPGPTDRPIIRLGNRRDMYPILVDTEAELPLLIVGSGQVGVALSTGKLKLSDVDIGKADPTSFNFDKHYFGEQVVYGGVSLNQRPQPTKAPVRLTEAGGTPAVVGPKNTLFVPDSVALPDDFTSDDPYRGLGISGVMDAPDGTGAIPDLAGTPAAYRPGGNTLDDPTTGRVRQVRTLLGDTFCFSRRGVVEKLEVVLTTASLPSERRVPEDTVYVAKEYVSGDGSQVALGPGARSKYAGDPIYFAQTDFTPAYYSDSPKLYSRNRLIFRFSTGDTLYFAVDGTTYTWTASSLPAQDFYTAEEVAASIYGVLTGTGDVYALNGRVVIEGTDSVEIGWGASGLRDLSGATSLGFQPGWRTKIDLAGWLIDSGVSFGLRRSPVNLDRSLSTPDYAAEARIDDYVLIEDVQPFPFTFLNPVPLQDVAGFDEDVFFHLTSLTTQGEIAELIQRPLRHYEDIQYRFGEGKFAWLEEGEKTETLQQPVSAFQLGNLNVVPETLLNAPGIGGGLYVAEEGGQYELLEQGVEYLLPGDGASGYALLSDKIGGLLFTGALGAFDSGGTTFTDLLGSINFEENVGVGFRLKITSGPVESLGSYIVREILSPVELRVEPPFLATPDRPVAWEIYSGIVRELFDPALVADVLYKPFNLLQEEPFQVRVLTLLGTVETAGTGRFQADVGRALDSGRLVNLRYGLEAPNDLNTATLYELDSENLGTLADVSLVVPTTDHVTAEAFSIRVGTRTFVQGVDLLPVTFFSVNPGSGDAIEYLTTDWSVYETGTLHFGSNVLTGFAGADVFYVETFREPADIPSLVADFNRNTGEIQIAEDQLYGFDGTDLYFVEQMVTENRQDVGISPMIGAFSFNTPIAEGQVVEATYYQADTAGRRLAGQITEFLPVMVRDEVTTRVDEQNFDFNLDGNTVDTRFEPVVYIGPVQ